MAQDAQDGPYTASSLALTLGAVHKPLQRLSEHVAALSGSANFQQGATGSSANPYGGLWKQLVELETAICLCLSKSTSQPGSPSVEANAERKATIQGPPPILESCLSTVESLLRSGVKTFPLEEILQVKSKVLWFQRSISNADRCTTSRDGLLFYLSLLPGKPPRDFQALEVPALELQRWQATSSDKPLPQNSSKLVSYWISLLNSAFNDREPEEYHQEKMFADLRRQAVPDYAEAAADWPEYASRYWTVLRPQIFSLFNSSKSFNFVQWALEFARQTWPIHFGEFSTSAEPLMDLTDALCSGTVSPLHVAAALGLPDLCRDLLSSGSMVNRGGPWGTPLICALVGWDSFLEASRASPWSGPTDPIMYANSDRVQTILLLIKEGADSRSRYTLGDEETSILFLAFWASLMMRDESVLHKVNEGGAEPDQALVELLQYPEVEKEGRQNPELLSELLTYLFDLSMENLGDFDSETGVNDAIQHLMSRLDIGFACKGGHRALAGIADDQIFALADTAVLQGLTFELKRLALDPRFDPNPESVEEEDCDSLLHMAVASDSAEMVDILVEAGANLNAMGHFCRTPVMVVESVMMLEKLVLQYGATTTTTDLDGRNIWHYAAATNDMGLLTWLCEKDPWKQQNLNAVTDRGCTPLAEAFLFIESLASQPSSMGIAQAPVAARRLLQECYDDSSLSSPIPLTHLAAAWGELELVEGLVSMGANFRQLDEDGYSALHHVNFSASAKLIKRLQGLCSGASIETYEGHTPAETIFTNFRPSYDDSDPVPSLHPSCKQSLSEDAYSLLLNSATMQHLDARNNCFWRRFCSNVIERNPVPNTLGRAKRISVLHDSIARAIRCIVRAGGLDDYEEERGVSAVMCFLGGQLQEVTRVINSYERRPRPCWNVKYFYPYIMATLENSGASVVEKFYRSDHAVHLLAEAAVDRKMTLVRHLCAQGVSVLSYNESKGPAVLGAMYPLDWTLELCPDTEPLGELLKHVTSKELNDSQQELLTAINTGAQSGRVSKLEMLLRKGFNPDHVSKGYTALGLAIMRGFREITSALLQRGADLTAGGPRNAVFCAVLARKHEVLVDIIGSRAGKDFPWSELQPVPTSGTGGPVGNAVHLASAENNYDALGTLFRMDHATGLVAHINDLNGTRNGAHLAAEACGRESIKVLHEFGADLTIRDKSEHEWTPLHIAISRDTGDNASLSLIRTLVARCPASLGVRDAQGRTPLEFAVEEGCTDCLEVLGQAG